MKVLVTGATGFLGTAVVTAALAAGHKVFALRRPSSSSSESQEHPDLIWINGDLRQPMHLQDAVSRVEAVIHCAATASGDLSEQLAGTVYATENLLSLLPSHMARFVHVSTFSVYNFDAPALNGRLCEETPLEADLSRRDAYTATKLLQEQLVREYAAKHAVPLVVARPGAIYGPDKNWGFGSSFSLGRFDLIFAPLARMRLIQVENCADALVAALTAEIRGELIVNLVDAEQPSHWRFHRLARRHGADTGVPVPIPYMIVLILGGLAQLASRLFFNGRARLPEFLDPPRQRARWRPLRYSRERFEDKLKRQQRLSLREGVDLARHRTSVKCGATAGQ